MLFRAFDTALGEVDLTLPGKVAGVLPAILAISNSAATTNPGVGNDSSQGYSAGSVWFNTTTASAWLCLSAAVGAAAWIDITAGTFSAASALTAGTTRTQAGALALTSRVNRIDTSTAPAAGAILGDGVALPAALGGAQVIVINNTANPIQVYGVLGGSDTINGVAGATGIALPPNDVGIFDAAAAGSYQVSAGAGSAGQLATVLSANGITAAGTTQGTATQLASALSTVTTAGAGTGVNLPASAAGLQVGVINLGANPLLVYPLQGAADTINGQAAATGVSILPGTAAFFNCTVAGAWTVQPGTTTNTGYNAAANAAGFTATGAQITGGAALVVLDLTGNPAGAANAQLPTVAALVAAMHCPIAGSSFTLRVKNSGNSNTWTITTNTGWTLTGTMTIATGTYRDFQVKLTSLAAAVIQNIGGGATL